MNQTYGGNRDQLRRLESIYDYLLNVSWDSWDARQTIARLINEANNPHLWANWRDLT